MDARTFKDTYGRDEAIRVASEAGSNYEYFKQIMNGHRRPSVGLAERLVEASGDRMDLVSLLTSKKSVA